MIHQRKGNICLCVVIDVILRIDIKVENEYDKNLFFHFYFSNVHISVKNELEHLKLCICVANVHVEGSVSQIFDFALSGHCSHFKCLALSRLPTVTMVIC